MTSSGSLEYFTNSDTIQITEVFFRQRHSPGHWSISQTDWHSNHRSIHSDTVRTLEYFSDSDTVRITGVFLRQCTVHVTGYFTNNNNNNDLSLILSSCHLEVAKECPLYLPLSILQVFSAVENLQNTWICRICRL